MVLCITAEYPATFPMSPSSHQRLFGKGSNIRYLELMSCSCGSLFPLTALPSLPFILSASSEVTQMSSLLLKCYLCLTLGYKRTRSRQLFHLPPKPQQPILSYITASVLLNYNDLFTLLSKLRNEPFKTLFSV